MAAESNTGHNKGERGDNSTFDEIVAMGGGGGASSEGSDGNLCLQETPCTPEDGGSGGGSGHRSPNPGTGLQPELSYPSGSPYGFGNRGGHTPDDPTVPEERPQAGGGGAGERGQDGSGQPSRGGDGLNEVTIDSTIYNFRELFGNEFGEEHNGEVWFAGGGGGGNEGHRGGIGGGGDAAADGSTSSSGEDGVSNTGGGGGSGNQAGTVSGGDGGSGIVLIRYQSDLSICDRRGLFNQCISNSTHEIDGESFELESVFESESTAVFEALDQKASITVSNSSIISGTWRGEFDIQSDSPRIGSGAEFRPEGERIVIGN